MAENIALLSCKEFMSWLDIGTILKISIGSIAKCGSFFFWIDLFDNWVFEQNLARVVLSL